jgi:cysteine-rich repeat protein
VVDPGEQCDDGNATDCDGCSARCTREVVGNGVIDTECGEVCDGDDVAGQTRPGGPSPARAIAGGSIDLAVRRMRRRRVRSAATASTTT